MFIEILAAQSLAFAFAQQSTSEMREEIIEASISIYDGNCPCPYNLTANGSRCGARSAWSKVGGADPYCFERDIASHELEELFQIATGSGSKIRLLRRQ